MKKAIAAVFIAGVLAAQQPPSIDMLVPIGQPSTCGFICQWEAIFFKFFGIRIAF